LSIASFNNAAKISLLWRCRGLVLRVLVADDNKEMCEVLKKELQKDSEIVIVASAYNGVQLIDKAEKFKPDVIFVDIEMPIMSGLEAAKKIRKIDDKVSIVFLTAYDTYLKEAFDLYAVDYMEKPLNKKRLWETVRRIKRFHSFGKCKIEIKSGNENLILNGNEIIFAEAMNKKTLIHLTRGEVIADIQFKEIIKKLKQLKYFVKTHRSYTVNINYIEKVKKNNKTSFIIFFRETNKTAYLTRSRYNIFRKKFEEIIIEY
jgi:DNA-binding LytR/AlgR family response regulator